MDINHLLDDLLLVIFSFCPVPTLLISRAVCRHWNAIIRSRFSELVSNREPFYFLIRTAYKENDEGSVFDPSSNRWYQMPLPFDETAFWLPSSSNGLVCFIDERTSMRLFVCNPFTRASRDIPEPPSGKCKRKYCCRSVHALSVDSNQKKYIITLAKTMPLDEQQKSRFSVEIFYSETNQWVTAISGDTSAWFLWTRGYNESTICNGLLFCLIHRILTNSDDDADIENGLLIYDLRAGSSKANAIDTSTALPPMLLSCSLVNVKNKLLLVGQNKIQNGHQEIVTGIGIWQLCAGRKWKEIARVPDDFFKQFKFEDEMLVGAAGNGLIYIQNVATNSLLVFNQELEKWYWSPECPVCKRKEFRIFFGFSFHPRLDVVP